MLCRLTYCFSTGAIAHPGVHHNFSRANKSDGVDGNSFQTATFPKKGLFGENKFEKKISTQKLESM